MDRQASLTITNTTGRRAEASTQRTASAVLLGKMHVCQMDCAHTLANTTIVRRVKTRTGQDVNWFAPKVSKNLQA